MTVKSALVNPYELDADAESYAASVEFAAAAVIFHALIHGLPAARRLVRHEHATGAASAAVIALGLIVVAALIWVGLIYL